MKTQEVRNVRTVGCPLRKVESVSGTGPRESHVSCKHQDHRGRAWGIMLSGKDLHIHYILYMELQGLGFAPLGWVLLGWVLSFLSPWTLQIWVVILCHCTLQAALILRWDGGLLYTIRTLRLWGPMKMQPQNFGVRGRMLWFEGKCSSHAYVFGPLVAS